MGLALLLAFLLGVAALGVASKDVTVPFALLLLGPLISVVLGRLLRRKDPGVLTASGRDRPSSWLRFLAGLASVLAASFCLSVLTFWVARALGITRGLALDEFRAVGLTLVAGALVIAWLLRAVFRLRS